MKKYGVVLADPPWSYSNSGVRGAAANHYPTMHIDDICALPVKQHVKRDAVLILWATWPLLPEAMRVIDAWGFKYKTGLPWIKMNGIPTTSLFGEVILKPLAGQGWWVRGVSEPILICTRGNASPPSEVPMGLISERFRHSKKPANAHEYAELFPGPYLEMFARTPRAGWDVFGNEVEGSVALEAA